MSKSNYGRLIDELIDEVERELEESTATGAVAGYETPNAFGNGSNKSKNKTKKVSTQAGYTIVDNDVDNINEAVDLTDIVKLAKAQDKGNLDTFKINKPFKVLTKTGITTVTPVPITSMEKGKFVKTMHFKVGGKQFVKLSGIVKMLGIKENVTEAKLTVKRSNRWLELKNDETMHPHKKLSVGLKELKNQLKEVEQFLGWYNKIKNINELDSDNYWKRTNKNINNIKERIVNIVHTLREIEK